MFDQPTKAADTAAVVSSLGAFTSWVVNAMPWVQFVAGLVAIIAGICASIYHIKKIRQL
jgi:hypothetical protein